MPFENYGPGIYGPYYNAGAPAAGTDEIQTATFGGTWLAGEKFRLVYDGFATGLIDWSATNNTLRDHINTALNALPNLGTSWAVAAVGTMTLGIGTMLVTFSGGDVSKKNVSLMTVRGSTSVSGTLSVATSTPGVPATYRDAQKGSELVDVSNAIDYIKTGNTGTGTYTKTGTQS